MYLLKPFSQSLRLYRLLWILISENSTKKKLWNSQFLLKSDTTSETSKRERLCVSACILHSLLVYQREKKSSDGNVSERSEAYFVFNVIFYGFRCNYRNDMVLNISAHVMRPFMHCLPTGSLLLTQLWRHASSDHIVALARLEIFTSLTFPSWSFQQLNMVPSMWLSVLLCENKLKAL
jgi:hypothetical protein